MHEKILDRSLKSWAYYLLISLWIKQYLTITPRQNLVINLGINKNGTNTKNMDIKQEKNMDKIDKPLVHPSKIIINENADNYVFKNIYKFFIK